MPNKNPEKRKEYHRLYMRKYSKIPEVREATKKRNQKYCSSPEGKEVIKKRNNLPKRKEYFRKWSNTPERKAKAKKWRQEYEKTPRGIEAKRRYNLKRNYGLGWDDYCKLLKEQKGLCAICFESPKKGYTLNVDHCHKTKIVRGLLCTSCNTAIGLLSHSTLVLQEAIRYLEKYNIF